jgi:cytochrome P450 / NADPH-cytochrome P450 reductase
MDMSGVATKTIPQPRPRLFLGNALELAGGRAIEALMRLARKYGPIYRLQMPGQDLIIVSSQELAHEVCDETRFDKQMTGTALQLRAAIGPSLASRASDDPIWGIAHRILLPGIGRPALRSMVDSMWDITEQLLSSWEAIADRPIDVADSMTRLTLDTIALAACGYRFNSFRRVDAHPFAEAMVRLLDECTARARRPALLTRLMLRKARRRAADLRLLFHFADEAIAQRRERGPQAGSRDFLDLLLEGKDPKTGAGLSAQDIRSEVVGLLLAGQETTSSLLTFALYELLEHPEVLARARAEVDRVLGDQRPQFEHLTQLSYVDHVVKETLRLWPVAPATARRSIARETTIGGGYPVHEGQTIVILFPMLHRDPAVWGEDADRFEPDRFARGALEKLPPHAWIPFAAGLRACTGRALAMQEAILLVASVLQRFDIAKADRSYRMRVSGTGILKMQGFFIKAKRRPGVTAPRPSDQPDDGKQSG